jgi:hypothetical protein
VIPLSSPFVLSLTLSLCRSYHYVCVCASVRACVCACVCVRAHVYCHHARRCACPTSVYLDRNVGSRMHSLGFTHIIPVGRVMGVRFLYPVLLISDVEMTCGMETSSETIEQMKSLLYRHNKKPFMKTPGSGNHLVLTEAMIQRQCVPRPFAYQFMYSCVVSEERPCLQYDAGTR